MSRARASLIGVICLGLLSSASAGETKNIATGAKYRLEPAPNYSYCTDAGDVTQLTDGQLTKNYFWTEPSTVGWSSANPAIITLDLGRIAPITGFSYNTAAGVAGVIWPNSIQVLVSDDDQVYYGAGDLVAADRAHGEPSAEGYSVHRYWSDNMPTHGRFIKMVVTSPGPYIFVDEIEVFAGDESLLASRRPGPEIRDVKKFFGEIEIRNAIRRRMENDLKSVGANASGKLAEEAKSLEQQVRDFSGEVGPEFRAVLPLNEVHRRIFELQARTWKERFEKPLLVWQTNRWDMLSPTEMPDSRGATIQLPMMLGEHRSAAFNVSNASEQPTTLQLRFEGLPGGSLPDYLTVHEVAFTDTKRGVAVAAALPLAVREADACGVQVDAGMTKQIWIDFHPTQLAAGVYSGNVVIEPGGHRVPLQLKVYPLRFPDRPTLHLGGWDYTDAERSLDVTPETRPQLIEHLRQRFVDSPWATGAVLPPGKFDATGKMTEPPSDERLRSWIALWPDARNYYVFAAVGDHFGSFAQGTPEFNQAVGDWITFWADRLRKLGVSPSKLGLLLVDEPHERSQDETIAAYARVIQRVAPEVVVWEDPTYEKPAEGLPEMYSLSDVLCPNLPMWINGGASFTDFYRKQQSQGRTLWLYSCSGPGKLLDPYSYHRMQHWFCWKYGAVGSGFWAFGDSGGTSSWNEYLSPSGAFTPVYLDAKSVTAGKHMEAIREGIEDYEYLRMLKEEIAAFTPKSDADSQKLTQAKQLLDTAADRVTACMTTSKMIEWQQPKDRSTADTVRAEILDMIVALSGK